MYDFIIGSYINTPNIDAYTIKHYGVVLVDKKDITNTITKIDVENGLIIYDNLPKVSINKLSGEQLNQSFHKSWQTIKETDLSTLIAQQLIHYISVSYQSAGLIDYIYIPLEKLEIPSVNLTNLNQLKFRVIRGITSENLITKVLEFISRPVPLKPETIKEQLEILNACSYAFTGDEIINNNEVKCYVYDELYPLLPNDSEDLFRLIYYKASGKSLIIKSKEVLKAIANTKFDLSEYYLKETHLHKLAASFNRRKELWLAIKKSNPNNIPIVNRISKFSKKDHKPVFESILKKVTSITIPEEDLNKAISKASTSQLISLLNVVLEYSVEAPRAYKIRNGKTWIPKINSNRKVDSYYYSEIKYAIVDELIEKRLKYKGKVYIPNYLKIALPKSEKDFVGTLPNGSVIEFLEENKTALVGIHWFNAESRRVDLDLKAFTLEGVIGWDANYRNNSMMFSGDVTTAPKPLGASEWLFCTNDIPILASVTVNNFSNTSAHPFTLILASSSSKVIEKNYIVDPNNVICTIPVNSTKDEEGYRGQTLGIFSKNKETNILSFTINNSDINNESSNRNVELMKRYKTAMYNKVNNCAFLNDLLKLSPNIELVDVPTLDCLNLSIENLTTTTLIDLFI